MTKTNKKVDDLLKNGIHSYRDAVDYIMGVMVEYQVALHPIHGFAQKEGDHPQLPNEIPSKMFKEFGLEKMANMVYALDAAYESIREVGYHPEAFTALFGSRLFAKMTSTMYGTNENEMDNVKSDPITIKEHSLIAYDEDTDLEEMITAVAAEDAQRSVQMLAMCGVPGFDLDGRGFIVLDASQVPDSMDGFINFLAENVDRMGGRETVMHIADGERSKESIVDEQIESIMMEDRGETPDHYDDIDPDSDENDDEVVRW